MFGKKLIIAEIVLVTLAVIFFPVATNILPENFLGGLPVQMESTTFQKQSILITAFLIAPLLALSMTLWDMNKK